MKKMISILSTFLIALTMSCTSDQMITDLPEDINKNDSGLTGPTTAKRGVGFSTNGMNWANRVVELKSNWYYTWGNTDMTDQVEGVEFVPMIWGHTGVTKETCDRINQLYSEGKVFYVLGFNEPDLKEESNMTVQQALEDWEFLCTNLDPRIKLVSPAPSYPSRQWLVDFMQGVQERGLRCDHVAVHIYAGSGTRIYETAIRDVYNKFGKSVWVTEFAPRDDSASSNGYNSYPMDPLVLNFMKTVVPKYEEMPEVFRYAWFSGSYSMLGLRTSMLVEDNGTDVTVLGEYYKTIEPNEEAKLPQQ